VSKQRLLPPRYRIVLAANLAFCVVGVFVALPSWRMFESVPDPRYTLTDANGAAVRAEDWLPRDAYAFSAVTLAAVARFACERNVVRPPLFLSSEGRRFTIVREGDRCVSRELADADP
jgi:hypothetical protein